MNQSSVKDRRQAVETWQNTPSANSRYKGATPADIGRALLRKPARHADKNIAVDSRPVKSNV